MLEHRKHQLYAITEIPIVEIANNNFNFYSTSGESFQNNLYHIIIYIIKNLYYSISSIL